MLPKKSKYALHALLFLARYPGTHQLIATIAKETAIPKKFLEQILLDLKKDGLLSSKKGLGGGYSLKIEPKDIPLLRIIRLTSGAVALAPCVSRTAYAPCDDCPNEQLCGLKIILEDLHAQTTQLLSEKTVADIALESQKLANPEMYHI